MDEQPPNCHDEALAAAREAGWLADLDCPDSLVIAEYRTIAAPGSDVDKLAESLAASLAGHASVPVTRATCAALARSAASLKALAIFGMDAHQVLVVLGIAAAKLEMKASANER